ncbi:MAG: UvrD-helicase domain-containing protein [Pseudomonadota bacterium]|nr:UvrD-helicase domain-containing protein [Pseudomonadota bacterium]
MRLNPQQDAAVRHVEGPLLVLAGAGSGKTRVIIRKIVHLAESCAVPADRIIAVTFTNKAAQEMKRRLGRALGGGRGPAISTFHRLGLRIIQQDPPAFGLRAGYTIFDAQDTLALLRELTHRQTDVGEAEQKTLQAQVSAWKNALLTPAEVARRAGAELASAAALFEAYERHLRAYNALDFDDLIVRPVLQLTADQALRERWQQRLGHLLVDEYQDTNAAQYALMKLLVGRVTPFTVVGDDDQSIYAWRGARPENLHDLQQDFPRLRVVKLEQNYRSTRTILTAANTLIAGNPHLFEKRLWSELGPGDPIRVWACGDGEAEVARVVADLLTRRFQAGGGYGGFAILYRSNHQARPFEQALREHGVPYQITGGPAFFDAAEVRDVLAYLRLAVNPDDDAAFLRIINTPRRELGAATLERLGNYAQRRGVSMLAACREMALTLEVGERACERLVTFAEFLEHMHRLAETEPPVACVRRLLEAIEYDAWLLEQSRDRRAAERRQRNVAELIGWFERLEQRWEDEAPTLAAVLAHLALLDVLERQRDDAASDQVQLMTLHSAKGLEFDHVYLVGMEENLLPHRNALEAQTLEEERRLAYVGITRARRSLTLTCALKRRQGGEEVDCEPSRFLAELPAELLAWERADAAVAPAERKARGAAHMAKLKAMLQQDPD